MVRDTEQHGSTRRRFLQGAGLTGAALVGSLAGCTGDTGGGGTATPDDSGSGGGSGGDADEGGGPATTTADTELTSIRMGMPPLGPAMLALNYIERETDILANEVQDAGYEFEIVRTWDEITQFAAGKTDITPSLSDIEGSRLAVEREIPITFHGLYATNYEGLYVRKDSKWDPENSGSVEATFEMLANGEGTWGNAGWNQGSVVAGQLVMNELFDYAYGPDESDFTVQQADWAALPKLLAQGEVDMVTNGPPLGSAIQLAREDDGNNPIKDIYWYQPGLEEAGFAPTTANLGNFGTTQEFNSEHREAVAAFLRAWKQGTQYASNTDNFEEILSKQSNIDALGGNNREEAKVILEFSQDPPSWCMADPGNIARVIVEDPEIDEAYVQTDKEAITRAEELGSVPSGWQEYVEYDPIDI
jgi:hypothetical protein